MPQRFFVRLFASTAAIALGVGAWGQAPQDPVIVSGGVSVTRQGANTIVTQSTNRGVLDWRSFSIGPQETVRFDQPGRSSVTLNRVTGSELSRIDGQLSATGQVWLANPNGVLIGPGGRVNIGGLAATTGRIDVQEFLRSGKLAIDRIPSGAGIRNDGAISIAEGGYAALAAASIKNKGVINARAGSIALGSGRAMVMDFHGDRLIQFQVTEALDQAPIDADALINADGQMVAIDGQVQLSARAAKGVIDNAINLKGHVIANRVRIDGGTVTLGDGGAVRLSGRIDASNPQGKGGAVAVLGEAVGLMDGASIDASGAKGGGEVLVGGDWQGKGGQNAAFAYVAPTATIKADASEAGDGGKVVVWADDTTRFNGAISARGAGGGAGGQVETSGKRALDVSPAATVTVAGEGAGKPGAWLLDPTDITISASGAAPLAGGVFDPLTSSTISTATISAGLATGDVTIKTSSGTGGAGDISFQSGTISYGGSTARTLSLLADRNITLFTGTRIDLNGAANNVRLNASASAATQAAVNGNIEISGSTIVTAGGAIYMVGGAGGAFYAEAKGSKFTGIRVSSSVLNAGSGTILARGIGNQAASSLPAHGFFNDTSSMTANGGITLRGISGPGSVGNDSHGVMVYWGNLTATGSVAGTGGIVLDGETRGVQLNARAISLHANSAVPSSILFGADGFTGTGLVGTGGTGFGFGLYGMTLSGTGSVNITANRAATSTAGVFNFNKSGPYKASIISTGGDIRLTSLANGTNNSRVIPFRDESIIRTNAGDITIDISQTPGGLVIYEDAKILTSSGHISIIGAPGTNPGAIRVGARDAANNSDGTIAATGAGGRITLTGQSTGAANAISLERGVLTTVDQPIKIVANRIGYATTLANLTISSGQKTIFEPFSTATSIGVAGGAGTLQLPDNLFQRINGPVEIGRSDGTGLITVAANAQLRQDMGLISTGGVTFLGPVNGDAAGSRSLTVSAGASTVSFGGSVGATTSLSKLTVASGVTATAGPAQFVTTGEQSYSGSVLLAGPTTFQTTNSDVSFSGSVDGATVGQTLTASLGTGTIGFASGAGANTALGSLTVGAARIAGVIATTGAQSYGQTVATADATLRADNAPISFSGSLDGPGAVRLENGTGATSFGGAVGATTRLGSLTQVGTGKLTARDQVRTDGSQSYAGAVVVASNTNFDASSGDITFSGGLNGTTPGDQSVTLATPGGAARLPVGAGAVTALASLTAGAARIAGTIATQGTQSYGGSVLLSGPVTFQTTNSDVSFGGSVDGTALGQTLTASLGTGTIGFANGAGSNTALGSLTVGAARIAGTIATTGAQSYGQTVATADATLRADNAPISFSGSLDGPGAVRLENGTGSTSFGGAVGALTRLGALTQVGTGQLTARDQVRTDGSQSYAGSVVVASNTSFDATSGDITFSGGLNGTTPGDQSVTLTTPGGAARLPVGAGAITALASLTAGAARIAGTIATTGAQSYGQTVATADATLRADNAPISFSGSLDGPGAVRLENGTGAILFGGAVGALSRLGSLTQVGTGKLTARDQVRTDGSQSYAGAVVVASNTSFDASSGDITFSGGLNGTTPGDQSVTLATASGAARLPVGAGAITALASLTAGAARIAGTIATTGAQSYGQTVATADATLRADNAPISFSGSLDGPGAVRLENGTGATSFGGAVGALTRLGSLTQTGTGQLTARDQVRTVGSQSYAGSVVVASNTSFDASNGDIAFDGELNGTNPGAQSVSLSTGPTGTARLAAGAGRTTALASLSAGAARIAGTVATTGAQSYTGSVVLAGAVQLKTSGGDVTFKEAVNGATNSASLQASTGAGTISFAKGLGTTTQLASLSAGAAAVGKTIWTVGTQEYSVIMLMEDVTLRTSDAAIKVAGAINGPGGLTLEAGAGAVSLGGAVGAGTRVASLTQTSSGPLTVTDGVYTDGAQSYAGPVILGGSTVFDALNGIIDFSAGLDGSTVGGQSARINVDGSGKARLPVGAGATTALASLSLYHGPNSTYAAAEIGGTVSTIGGQRYDAVTLLSDVTLSTNNAPIYFDYSLDGPNKLKLSAGGADVTLPPLFVTPVPIDRVGVGRVYVPSLPSFGTRPSQASVAAFGTSPSIASQPSRPSGPGSPGDTPVVAAPTPTTPSLTSSPTFGSAPSVATLASQPTIETAKPAPPLFPLPPTPPNRGEPSPSAPPQQDFVGAPPLDMNSRLIKLMRDFAPREEDEVSTLDLTQGALNADTSFDRTDPARPGPTIKFTITSKPLR